MGVDYRADFGIGYEIGVSAEVGNSEEFQEDFNSSVEEYLMYEISDTFEVKDYGNHYTDEISTIITIIDPFRDTLDLTESKKKLDEELERLDVEILSEFGLVGGYTVY